MSGRGSGRSPGADTHGGPWSTPVLRYGGSLIWVVFVVLEAIGEPRHHHDFAYSLSLTGAAAVVVLYVSIVFGAGWGPDNKRSPRNVILVGALDALAVLMTLGYDASWGFLFTYCTAMSGLVLVPRSSGIAIAALTAAAALCSAAAGASAGTTFSYAASAGGVGMLLLVLTDLRARNLELSRARAELARLAVAEERQRFARDLHDLLGHSLSVIALKAELAGRLIPERAEAAAHEVAELEKVARAALGEVREAVSGYREPTLAGELAGARMALAAAGIEAVVEGAAATEGELAKIPEEVQAVLAWAVREGATNVIRHSHARTCRIAIRPALGAVELEIVDDGIGPQPASGEPSGNGLSGLHERVQTLGGWIEAGPPPGGGFRLRVVVPDPRLARGRRAAAPAGAGAPARARGSDEPPAPAGGFAEPPTTERRESPPQGPESDARAEPPTVQQPASPPPRSRSAAQ